MFENFWDVGDFSCMGYYRENGHIASCNNYDHIEQLITYTREMHVAFDLLLEYLLGISIRYLMQLVGIHVALIYIVYNERQYSTLACYEDEGSL